MKHIIQPGLLLLLLITCFHSSAQKIPIHLGIRAGLNLSNSSMGFESPSYYNMAREAKPGFQAGITAEYGFTKAFYLQSGLFFTQKGVVLKGSDMEIGGPSYNIYWKQTVNQSYLQVPVMAAYKKSLTPHTKIFVQAGPYLAYGIGGKSSFKNTYENPNRQNDKTEENTFGEAGLQKFDWGLTAGAGVEIGKIVIGVNYELGFTDLGNNIPGNFYNWYFIFPYKNRNASLTIGFKL
jgi:hypothetical protein